MGDERAMQAAIMASLRPAGGGGGGGGGGGAANRSSSFTQSFRGPSATSTSAHRHDRRTARSDTHRQAAAGVHNRRSALSREGITATSTGGGMRMHGPTGSLSSRRAMRSSDMGRSRSASSAAATKSPQSSPARQLMRSSASGSVSSPGRSTPRQRDSGAPLSASHVCSFGDGWWQRSREGTGRYQRCGLHTVIESTRLAAFVLSYEPRSPSMGEVLRCTQAPNPRYNLEVDCKAAKHSDPGPDPQMRFTVLFGVQSPGDFFMVSADIMHRLWILERVAEGGVPVEIECAQDESLRANVFYSLLLQVRGNALSLDANGVPIFTSVRMAGAGGGGGDSEQKSPLSGPCGVMAQQSKMVFKNWNVVALGQQPRSGEQRPRRPTRAAPVGGGGGGGGPPRGWPGQKSNHRSPTERYVEGDERKKGHPWPPAGGADAGDGGGDHHDDRPFYEGRAPYTGDDGRHIIELVERDIIDRNLGVTFDDIAALADAKQTLNEAVALPLLVPEFFVGIREPWRGILLFGPPGTGKTMLATAVAGMNGSNFFNCSTASLISKYHGESEKIVRCLFSMARHYNPSIIFLDELDALVSRRGERDEHEASRRLKTEIFTQMDGVTTGDTGGDGSGQQVMVLGTTNCPWDLDDAMLRRMEKRIYIPLPDEGARREMFALNLRNVACEPDVSTEALARLTPNYSGADILLICREASMMPMRRLIEGKTPQEIGAMRQNGTLETPPVSVADFDEAVRNTRPSVSLKDLARFEKWAEEFGSSSL